jgi:hypothetical protein
MLETMNSNNGRFNSIGHSRDPPTSCYDDPTVNHMSHCSLFQSSDPSQPRTFHGNTRTHDMNRGGVYGIRATSNTGQSQA